MIESLKKSQTLVEEALGLPGRGGNGTVKVAQVRQKRRNATARTGLLGRGPQLRLLRKLEQRK